MAQLSYIGGTIRGATTKTICSCDTLVASRVWVTEACRMKVPTRNTNEYTDSVRMVVLGKIDSLDVKLQSPKLPEKGVM